MTVNSRYFDRRDVLRLMAGGAGALALQSFAGPASAAVDEIVWATYETTGRADYFKPYTAKTGIRAGFSYITSDDALFAALKAGSADNWDVLNPGLNGLSRYVKGGLLHAIDYDKLPNAASMYKPFKTAAAIHGDDGKSYGVPYLWGLNPIVYRSDVYDKEPDYNTLFDPKYSGQLAMHDFALEGVVIAALHLGIPRDKVFDLGTPELTEIKKALLAQKPLLRTYWQTISDLTNLFATNEVTCAFCWRVPYDALKDKMKVAMAKPKAGIFGWCDCLAIPAGLPDDRLDAALGFIDYLLGPEFALDMEQGPVYSTTTPVIRDQLTVAQQANIFVDDLSIMDSFIWPVNPPNYADWLKLWNDVKAS
jgi:spermidine/putrescine transport system substrate-binding protein